MKESPLSCTWKRTGKLPDAPAPMLLAVAENALLEPALADDGDTEPAVRSACAAALQVNRAPFVCALYPYALFEWIHQSYCWPGVMPTVCDVALVRPSSNQDVCPTSW